MSIILIIGVLAAILVLAIAMLVLHIDQAIIIPLISVIGGVLPVGLTYVFTKNKEIEIKKL